jgi:hypothetical protein
MNRFSLFLLALLYLPVSVAQQVAEPSPIGYATIEEAFNALKVDPAVEIYTLVLYT